MSKKRDDIIEATSELLERQGYFATGLNQIVEESGAPKGSLYYYFPGGKDEITEEAIRRAGKGIVSQLDKVFGAAEDAAAGILALVDGISGAMEASDFEAGGPITTVAIEAAGQNERLSKVCQEVYESWQGRFERYIAAGGVEKARARQLASLVLSSMEGAIILSRTYRSVEPLQRVGKELGALISSA